MAHIYRHDRERGGETLSAQSRRENGETMNCLICGVYIPEGSHVCAECRKEHRLYADLIDYEKREYEDYNKLLEKQREVKDGKS